MSNAFPLSFLLILTLFSSLSFAGKPQSNQTAAAVTAPVVHLVRVDYNNATVIVSGDSLDPTTAALQIAGISELPDLSVSTASVLVFPWGSFPTVVTEQGTYPMTLTTSGGNQTVDTFIPLPFVLAPPPPPPGPDCPCSTEWDDASTTNSPNGFADVPNAYCDQSSANFSTVQFYDALAGNYWVLWTGWDGSSGYCELYIDGPDRTLATEDQFNACTAYLANIVTVFGSDGYDCIF